jgi:hypothetical protein
MVLAYEGALLLACADFSDLGYEVSRAAGSAPARPAPGSPDVGHAEELLVDVGDWTINYIRIDTCKWRPGDKVLLAPRCVREIDWPMRSVRFNVDRRGIEDDHACCEVVWMRRQSHVGTHYDV